MSRALPQVSGVASASLPLLEVRGDANQRGFQQGRRARTRWHQAYESIGRVLGLPAYAPVVLSRKAIAWTFRTTGTYYLYEHRRDLGVRRATELAFLQGMSAGAELPLGEIYGVAASEVSLTPGWALGCAAFAFSANRTQEGLPLHGYNHDYPEALSPHLILRRSEGPDCRTTLSLTYSHISGCLGGVNDAGLSVTLNAGYAKNRGRGSGLLGTLAAQRCLDRCSSTAEAVELLRATRFVSGCIFTLCDASSEIAVIEAAPMSVQLRRPKNGTVHAFNKYHHPLSVKNEVPLGAVSTGLFGTIPIHLANLNRELRLKEMVHHENGLKRDDLIRLLSDHGESEGSRNTICAHGGPHQQTLASLVISPKTRSLQAAWGPPCRTHFVEYHL